MSTPGNFHKDLENCTNIVQKMSQLLIDVNGVPTYRGLKKHEKNHYLKVLGIIHGEVPIFKRAIQAALDSGRQTSQSNARTLCEMDLKFDGLLHQITQSMVNIWTRFEESKYKHGFLNSGAHYSISIPCTIALSALVVLRMKLLMTLREHTPQDQMDGLSLGHLGRNLYVSHLQHQKDLTFMAAHGWGGSVDLAPSSLFKRAGVADLAPSSLFKRGVDKPQLEDEEKEATSSAFKRLDSNLVKNSQTELDTVRDLFEKTFLAKYDPHRRRLYIN